MSNHASSFMDPLVVASGQKPIVFFMTRADIYNGIMKFIFWLAHMLPIYRKQDGGDTKKQNEKVFKRCFKVLKYGRNLIVFAEGFTDNVFIRRLKPVKKGALRIGFSALKEYNWKYKIYVQAVGVNYSDPSILGSDCLISNSDSICLNDFKSDYENDPGKTIYELTLLMEQKLRNQITDIRNEKLASFHENIMRLTRKGMNTVDSNKSISLLKRWEYSKNLADWFNSTDIESDKELMQLKSDIENYFKTLSKEGIEETPLYKVTNNKQNKGWDICYLIALFPFMVVGQLFTYLPVKWIKRIVEKSFKRKVFWSSVKMLVGFAAVGIYNLIIALIIALFTDISFGLLIGLGIFIVPVTFVVARCWKDTLQLYKKIEKVNKKEVSSIVQIRTDLIEKIYSKIPVA